MDRIDNPNICVVGIGDLGFAWSVHLATSAGGRYSVSTWEPDPEVRRHLGAQRQHPYFHREVELPPNVNVCRGLEELPDVDVILSTVPSSHLRACLRGLMPHLGRPVVVVNTTRGLDAGTGQRLSEVCAEELPERLRSYALLTGAVAACDLLQGEGMGAGLACPDAEVRAFVQHLLESELLALDGTEDLLGAEYASAFANVIAVAVGIASGAGQTPGAQARLVCNLAVEIEDWAAGELGARPETFRCGSSAFGGELWLSANALTPGHEFGILLGRGFTLDDALEALSLGGRDLEGWATIRALGRTAGLARYPRLSALFDFVVGASAFEDLAAGLFDGRRAQVARSERTR